MPEYKHDFLGWKFSIILDKGHPLNDSPLDVIKEWAEESQSLTDDGVSLESVENLGGIRIFRNENGHTEEEQSNTKMLTFWANTDPSGARRCALHWLEQFS